MSADIVHSAGQQSALRAVLKTLHVALVSADILARVKALKLLTSNFE